MATSIETNKRVFSNLKAILFTPWESDSALGDKTYDLKAIVGDTTSVEQEDNEVNELAHEFSSTPLYENVNLGKKTFTTECIDFQNIVLKELLGWTVDETNGLATAPVTYKDLYCKIEMQFNSTEDIVVLPKVKLNSKAILSSMKTDASRANISGTCYTAYIKSGSAGTPTETDMAVVTSEHSSDYEVTASAS